MNIDLKRKNIINIDETWLGMTDFRRMQWQFPGLPNSVAKKQMSPRVSMIAALDTSGRIHVSLLQSNNNSQTMEVFFTHLINMLDEKDRYWRKNTIFMCDGASYHTSEVMRNFYKTNNVPLLFTGPHSYAASPIELFFAAFKKGDVNPNKVATGKQ